jgi:hypothetical protein
LISIGTIDTPIESLIQTAQENGFSLAGSYGGEPLTEDPEEALQAMPSLLYVDESWFLLRVTGEDLDYTVRPTGEGYELVLVPHKDLPLGETVETILSDLQGMGVVGSVDMELTSQYAKESEKGPRPPEGVAIDSALYGLPEAFIPFIESESGELAKLLLPIWQLTELARSSSIGYVRLPYRPQPSVP